jgi:hypothetical protein
MQEGKKSIFIIVQSLCRGCGGKIPSIPDLGTRWWYYTPPSSLPVPTGKETGQTMEYI